MGVERDLIRAQLERFQIADRHEYGWSILLEIICEFPTNETVPVFTHPILEHLDHMEATYNMYDVPFPLTLGGTVEILRDLHLAFDTPDERRVPVQETSNLGLQPMSHWNTWERRAKISKRRVDIIPPRQENQHQLRVTQGPTWSRTCLRLKRRLSLRIL